MPGSATKSPNHQVPARLKPLGAGTTIGVVMDEDPEPDPLADERARLEISGDGPDERHIELDGQAVALLRRQDQQGAFLVLDGRSTEAFEYCVKGPEWGNDAARWGRAYVAPRVARDRPWPPTLSGATPAATASGFDR
jgi:hypothetical protein